MAACLFSELTTPLLVAAQMTPAVLPHRAGVNKVKMRAKFLLPCSSIFRNPAPYLCRITWYRVIVADAAHRQDCGKGNEL